MPSPRAFRSPSRLSTSIRVEASSMLMISSATRNSMSSSNARAISRRCSWPPLSWCGNLLQHLLGVERDRLERRVDLAVPLGVGDAAEVRLADHLEDAVGLEDRVVRAERVLEDALRRAGSTPSAATLQRGDVEAVEGDRPARDRRQAQDHLPDRALAAAALADQRRRPRRRLTSKLTSRTASSSLPPNAPTL